MAFQRPFIKPSEFGSMRFRVFSKHLQSLQWLWPESCHVAGVHYLLGPAQTEEQTDTRHTKSNALRLCPRICDVLSRTDLLSLSEQDAHLFILLVFCPFAGEETIAKSKRNTQTKTENGDSTIYTTRLNPSLMSTLKKTGELADLITLWLRSGTRM